MCLCNCCHFYFVVSYSLRLEFIRLFFYSCEPNFFLPFPYPFFWLNNAFKHKLELWTRIQLNRLGMDFKQRRVYRFDRKIYQLFIFLIGKHFDIIIFCIVPYISRCCSPSALYLRFPIRKKLTRKEAMQPQVAHKLWI